MAMLKSSVVQGSLRVTDTTYTNLLNSTNGIRLISQSSAFNDSNIYFSTATNTNICRIGANGDNGSLGIYAADTIILKPGSATTASTTDGVRINGEGLTPIVTGTENLGTDTYKWANVYALTLNGNLATSYITGVLDTAHGGTGISTADPHKVLIGPATGTATAAPTWRQILNNEIAPIASKIYNAKVYGADGSGTCFYQNFMTVTPVDYNAIWTVTYRVIVTAEEHSDYTAIYDEKISGRSNTYYSWYSYNSLVSYPIYQHMLLNSPNINTPHEIGIRMASSYGDTTVAKKIQVDLLETYNCTAVLLDNLKYYTSATPSGCVWRTWNATSNGMQESGDNNDTGYYILSNGFKGQAGSNKVYRYCLFARTGDGTYESFVMQDNDRGTTKTANPHGFVPDGKIYWNSGNTTYSAGTLNISAYQQYHALDYLYSFNFSNTFLPDYCETYVVYTYNPNDGLLYLDTTQWFAGGLPTTEDGKIYQRIGSKYYTGTTNYYQGSLLLDNPYYEYKNGKIQTWNPLTTTEDSTNILYPIGVSSTATNILKHDSLITMTGGAISAASVTATRLAANGSNTSYNLYVSGNSLLANSITSGGNLNSQLIVSNPNGGDAAIELWRNTNASWQLANVDGTLYIRNNYTTSRQSYYGQNGIIIDYNSGNTAIAGTLAVGRSTRSTSDKLYVSGNSYLDGSLTVANATTLSSTLSVSGAATLNGSIIGKSDVNYGTALPSSGTTGQLFFQTSTLQYELPTGGTQGSFLIKASSDDRDVIWGDTVKRLTSNEGIAIASGGLLITTGGIVARNSTIEASKVYNAVWNDYAECRQSKAVEPGHVITEAYGGTMELATQRLMPACKVISDTYGTLMGESDTAKTPIAVAGRVLVYPYKNREQYQLGDAVCSAPNGTVDIMSREEITQYPERIVGTVSEIPTYEQWRAGTKENPQYIDVNGRIWIYVR